MVNIIDHNFNDTPIAFGSDLPLTQPEPSSMRRVHSDHCFSVYQLSDLSIGELPVVSTKARQLL